jgi:hypothetical protein
MSYAKLGLDSLSVPAKIQYGRRLVTALTGNPNFPTPNPGVAVLTAGADELEAAYNDAHAARLVAKTKTTVQDEKTTALDLLIAQLASYVDNASGGDSVKIESAGFDVRATPRPIGELPPPADLKVKPSEHAGSADVSWQRVHGARAYTIERSLDGAELDWKVIGICTKREAALNSMVSGKKYWFRVAAVGTAGQSAWSDPATLFAP